MGRAGAYMEKAGWVRRVGHYWWAYPALLATTLIPYPMQTWWWGAPYSIGLGVGAALLLICADMHDAHYCQMCVDSWPSHPSEVAERRWRWLWWYHFGRWVASGLYLATLIGFIWFSLPVVAIVLVLIGVAGSHGRSTRLHGQLAPWCPWCRYGHDGDEEAVEPTPTPSETRS